MNSSTKTNFNEIYATNATNATNETNEKLIIKNSINHMVINQQKHKK